MGVASLLLDNAKFMYPAYAWLRGAAVDLRIDREQAVYTRRVERAWNYDEAAEQLRRRLRARKLAWRNLSVERPLHVVYASRPSNWEPHNIPPQLAEVAKVTPYYFGARGFDDAESSWIFRRHELDNDILSFVEALHKRDPVHLFIGYLSGWQVARQTIEAIGAMGIVTCAFHWDDKLSFRGSWAGGRWSGPAEVAAAYDLNLTNAPSSILKYQGEGGIAIFWPEGANPSHFAPRREAFLYDVSFIGGRYGWRPPLVDFLRKHQINIEAFGPGWPNGTVSEPEMVQIINGSRINIGVGGIGYSRKSQCLKGRDFEIPMCGALYLTSYNPELELAYSLEREISTYRTDQECLDKVRFFLSNPSRADAIRHAARETCLRKHSWKRRFTDLIEILNAAIVRGTREC